MIPDTSDLSKSSRAFIRDSKNAKFGPQALAKDQYGRNTIVDEEVNSAKLSKRERDKFSEAALNSLSSGLLT
jgi:hypothetical protein